MTHSYYMHDLTNLRISMMKNKLIVCASDTKLPVYAIFNFPNSTDINLTDSSIEIKAFTRLRLRGAAGGRSLPDVRRSRRAMRDGPH